jgi:hypothetical protein
MYLGLCKNRFIRNGNDLAIRCRRWALMFHKNTLPAVSRFPQNILTERRKYLYVHPNHNETSSNIQEKYNNTRSAGDVYFGLHQAFKNTIRQDENTLLLRHVPGVPSLVSRRKMTLKLNYIYMKVLWMHKYCSPPPKLGITFLLKLIT